VRGIFLSFVAADSVRRLGCTPNQIGRSSPFTILVVRKNYAGRRRLDDANNEWTSSHFDWRLEGGLVIATPYRKG